MSETQEQGLSALLNETRTFPPPEGLAKDANAQAGHLRRGAGGPAGLLGGPGEAADLGRAVVARARAGTHRSPSGSSAGGSTWR